MEQVMHQDLSERIRERAYEISIASDYRDVGQNFLLGGQPMLICLGRGKDSRKADQRPGNG